MSQKLEQLPAKFAHTCHVLLSIWVPHVHRNCFFSTNCKRSCGSQWFCLLNQTCVLALLEFQLSWCSHLFRNECLHSCKISLNFFFVVVVDTQAETCWTGDLLPHVWACGMSCLPRVFLTAICYKNELTSLSVAGPFSAAWRVCICHWPLIDGLSTPLFLKFIFLLWNRDVCGIKWASLALLFSSKFGRAAIRAKWIYLGILRYNRI